MMIEPSDLIVPGIIFAGLASLFVGGGFLRDRLKRKHGKKIDLWFRYLHAPVESLLAASAGYAALRSLNFLWTRNILFRELYAVLLIVLIAWLAKRGIDLWFALAQRRPQGRLAVLRRFAFALINLIALSYLLLTFDTTRVFGFYLLVGTGLTAAIILASGHRTLGAAIAGLRLAMTQAVRIGDEIALYGGPLRVEAIHLTYAVLTTPEGRRVIAPIHDLSDQPVEILSRPQAPRT